MAPQSGEAGLGAIADFMVSSGLREAGYNYMYVNTDEGWESSKRDAQGRLQWSKSAYPSGGPAFIDRVHKQKLKFGFPAQDIMLLRLSPPSERARRRRVISSSEPLSSIASQQTVASMISLHVGLVLAHTIPKLPVSGKLTASTVDPSLLPSSAKEPAIALAEFGVALAALRAESGNEDYEGCANLLAKYCQNAAENLDDDRVRRIRCTNKAYRKHLDRFEAGERCLAAVGFVREQSTEGDEQLVLPRTTERCVLSAASSRLRGELRMRAVQREWPEPLRASLPSAASTLALRPELLEQLTAELRHPHVPAILQHGDNVERVTEQLVRSIDSAQGLLIQLQDLRKNLTATAEQQQQAAAAGTAPGTAGKKGKAPKGRVRKMSSAEEWYDLLMDAPGVVVAYFGAKWCKPCQLVKPLFATLSTQPQFSTVTFVHVDSDELSIVSNECEVAQLPTFKFFRDAADEGLPVVGADIQQVEDRLNELLAEA